MSDNLNNELWDIKDKALVVPPQERGVHIVKGLSGYVDNEVDNYVAAVKAMPFHLQRRWLRCCQTMDNVCSLALGGRSIPEHEVRRMLEQLDLASLQQKLADATRPA